MPRKAVESASKVPSATEVIKRRQKKAEFDTVPTVVAGISLRHEKGNIPDITKKTAGHLAVVSSEFVNRKEVIDELAATQKGPERELKSAAAEHRGFRGIESVPDNFRLSVSPSYHLGWDTDRLREDLGLNYGSIVHERLVANVSVPLGLETDEGPLTTELMQEALRRGLATLGLGRKAVESLISTETQVEVDETELARQLAAGKVSLSRSAATVTEKWAITVDPLQKGT